MAAAVRAPAAEVPEVWPEGGWLPALGWVFGSVPATALAGWTALAVVGCASVLVFGGLAAAVAGGPGRCVPQWAWPAGPGADVGVVVAGLWVLVQGGYRWYSARCRRLSRAWGLRVTLLVPEAPGLVRWLLRRRGLEAPARPAAFAVHVDTTWRAPRGTDPVQARREFGRLYREDYDRILGGLRGRPVLVVSSTFNRHESELSLRAMREGWGRQAPGPLLAMQPALNGPGRRARDQVRMFGAVITGRRVDQPEAWHCRVFDCQGAS